jgi:hypothetical protein
MDMPDDIQEVVKRDIAGLTVKVTFDLPFCLYID